MSKKRKELKYINYRNYFMVMGVLAFFVATLNIMYNLSTVFANNYASTIYPYWVDSLGAMFSRLPFAGIELIVALLILWLVFSITRLIVYYVKYHDNKMFFFMYRLRKSLLNLSVVLLVTGLFVTLNYGFNYHRLSFSVSSNIIPKEYSEDTLLEKCSEYIEKANELAITVASFDESALDIEAVSTDSMRSLQSSYPFMPDNYPTPKALFISGFFEGRGFFSPFTIEACYNNNLPEYEKIFTICHELAHVSGYMDEKEADFIAFLTCSSSTSVKFQYSGALHAVYSLLESSELIFDAGTYEELQALLSPQVAKDLETINSSTSMTDMLLAY